MIDIEFTPLPKMDHLVLIPYVYINCTNTQKDGGVPNLASLHVQMNLFPVTSVFRKYSKLGLVLSRDKFCIDRSHEN
jgi:hypothetical protein